MVPLVVPAALPSLRRSAAPTPPGAMPRPSCRGCSTSASATSACCATQYASMRDWVDAVLARRERPRPLGAARCSSATGSTPRRRPTSPRRRRSTATSSRPPTSPGRCGIVADAAALLGEAADAEHYATLAERTRAAFVAEYVTPAGRMMSDAPTAYALALGFDLVTDAAHPHARSRPASPSSCARAATASPPGFVGTPLVTDALTDGGHLDAAERLLLQTECPSWLYPVTMGATTVWERWDSLLPDGSVNPGEMTSFNHYALGAVADWLHRTVAGLAPDAPGYRRHPHRAAAARAALEHASARAPHALRRGLRRLAARRRRRSSSRAEVPPNTTAVVDLPGRRRRSSVGSGRHEWRFAAADRDAAQPSPVRPRLADAADHRRPRGVPRAARHARRTTTPTAPRPCASRRCGRDGTPAARRAHVHSAGRARRRSSAPSRQPR